MKTDQKNAITENDINHKIPVSTTEITQELPLLDIESIEQSNEEHADSSENSK